MATTITYQRRNGGANLNLSDEQGSAIWHKSAPEPVRRAYSAGKVSKGWAAWSKYLAKRTRPLALKKLTPGKNSPLGWALPEDTQDRNTDDFLAEIERFECGKRPDDAAGNTVLLDWLADAAGAPPDPHYGLQALAWCRELPRLGSLLPSDQWWDLLDHLTGTAVEAELLDLEDDPLTHQLLAGELPLTLAYLFPEFKPCRKLAAGAQQALSAGLVDLLDGEGLPHADRLDLLPALLGTWTRCSALGSQMPKGCWTSAAQTQYEWLVRAALRLTRRDGSLMFSRGATGPWCEDLFAAALEFGGDEDDRDIAVLALPGQDKAVAAAISELALPLAGSHCEWAAATVLRSSWSRSAPRLAVLWPGDSVRMELATNRGVVWSGYWELEVSRDGKLLAPTSEWEEVCWVSDDDVDYLELEIDLADGVRVQRQVSLAREDGFLLLADAVLSDRSGRLEYRSGLPLSDNIAFRPAEETREGLLLGDKPMALVLPLALPEWCASPCSGSLTATVGRLELRQAAEGKSMFAPLFFDLVPRRMTRRLTWRQLTIAESLEIQPQEVAVGYRVMVGKDQWLIYRSLTEAANRTLLGHNLSTEMLIAQFDRDGEVVSLMEIE